MLLVVLTHQGEGRAIVTFLERDHSDGWEEVSQSGLGWFDDAFSYPSLESLGEPVALAGWAERLGPDGRTDRVVAGRAAREVSNLVGQGGAASVTVGVSPYTGSFVHLWRDSSGERSSRTLVADVQGTRHSVPLNNRGPASPADETHSRASRPSPVHGA